MVSTCPRPSILVLRCARPMKISVIVPALNEESTLPKALASVPRDAEVIVADGQSADGTREVAAHLDARVVTGEPGRGAQMNLGAKYAGGETLLFLHADCVLDPGADKAIEEALTDRRIVGGSFHLRIRPAGPPPGSGVAWIEPESAFSDATLRRSGSLRTPLGLRGTGRLSGNSHHGRCGSSEEAPEAWPAETSRRQRNDHSAPLGKAGADVDDTPQLDRRHCLYARRASLQTGFRLSSAASKPPSRDGRAAAARIQRMNFASALLQSRREFDSII